MQKIKTAAFGMSRFSRNGNEKANAFNSAPDSPQGKRERLHNSVLEF